MKYVIFISILLSSFLSFARPSRIEMMKVVLNDATVADVIADQEVKGFVFDGLSWSNSITKQSHFLLNFKKFELELTEDQKNFLGIATSCNFLVTLNEAQISSVQEQACTEDRAVIAEDDFNGETQVPLLEAPSIDDFDPKKFQLNGKNPIAPRGDRIQELLEGHNLGAQGEIQKILNELNSN